MAQYGGVAFGATVAGTTTLTVAGTVAVGALAGFASGAIMTGTLSGALKGAAWGALSAGVAFGIGHSSAFSSLYKAAGRGASLVRAAAHGLSRGIISMAQGGTFKAGFASGFSSSYFNPGTTMGGDGVGGFSLRTSIAAVVGGTASKIGGGKFSNGAVSGAFVHMFNHEASVIGKIKNSLNAIKNKAISIYENFKKIRVEGHQQFPGEINSYQRHSVTSYKLTREYGSALVRAAGVVNEIQGLILHDIPNLPARISGDSNWAFQWDDLMANEDGMDWANEDMRRY